MQNILTRENFKSLYKRYRALQKRHVNNSEYSLFENLKEKVWVAVDGQFIYNSGLDSRFEPDYYFRGIDEKGNNLYRFSEYNDNLIPCEMTESAVMLLTNSIKALERAIKEMEDKENATANYNDSIEYKRNANHYDKDEDFSGVNIRLYDSAVGYENMGIVTKAYTENAEHTVSDIKEFVDDSDYISVPMSFINAVFRVFEIEHLYKLCFCTGVDGEIEVTLTVNGVMFSFIYNYANKTYSVSASTIDSILINLNVASETTEDVKEYEHHVNEIFSKFAKLKYMSRAEK